MPKTEFIQCPYCRYALPFVDGRAVFGAEHLTQAQFVRYHGSALGCRRATPVTMSRDALEAQLRADGFEQTEDGSWRHARS